jgi:hypothetical protein
LTKRIQQGTIEEAKKPKSKGTAQGSANQDASQEGETDQVDGRLMTVAWTS